MHDEGNNREENMTSARVAFLNRYTGPFIVLVLLSVVVFPGDGSAQFTPPRIIHVINAADLGITVPEGGDGRQYYIDRGQESNITNGDTLNVYREKRLSRQIVRPLKVFVGTLVITDAQQGSALGNFTANAKIKDNPLIRYKVGMKGDLVVPRIVIDASVLFGTGSMDLGPGADEEFAKIAEFVQLYSPSKVFIDGHTDSDGDARSNRDLSKDRAKAVKQILVEDYEFITDAMIEARGYGEERPMVKNNTKANKALNRRIEILVWQ